MNGKNPNVPKKAKRRGARSSARGGLDEMTPARNDAATLIVKRIPGFSGKSHRCTVTYSDYFGMNTGAGTCGTYVFSANGLYDPNITGTGHQPMAFDQMMLSFEHYAVLRSKITVTARNTDTSYAQAFAISLNAGTTAVTDKNVLLENGMVVSSKLGIHNSSGSAVMKTLSIGVDVANFQSCPSVLSDPDLHGDIAANPAEQLYFHISSWNAETANVAGGTYEVFIEYDVVFLEPRKNSASLMKQLLPLVIEDHVGRAPLPTERKTPLVGNNKVPSAFW